MTLSTIIGLVWVFLVSIAVRGWEVNSLAAMVFWVGIAYIVVRVLESAGFVHVSLPVRHGATDR